MLVPVSWLKEYTDFNVPVEEFCDRMILSGSNIETVEEFGNSFSKIVVAKVVTHEKHPDADKLFVLTVDIGEDAPIQIVTGATNLYVGAYLPVILHGGKLPDGTVIKKGKLRGVESNGMCCSAQELGYKDKVIPVIYKDGIMILEKEYPLGMDISQALDLKDSVIEFEITPNRPDCLSMVGIAREAAAVFGTKVKYPDAKVAKEEGNASEYIQVEIAKPDLCPRYTCRVIKDVKIQQSPWWMQKRLIHAGMRPINNIVDITNYIMLEYGQPMHAFDIRDIAGGKIIVDTAKEGELFTTLDGTERKLEESIVMINDAEKAIGIGGIMGGLDSEIKPDTTTVVLESANFNGDSIRSSSKKLGLRTEASSRYEKGIDANLCHVAADRFCKLVEELEAGTIVGGSVDVYPVTQVSKAVDVRVDRVNHILGIQLPLEEMVKYFNALEMETQVNGNVITVTPPTIRQDLLEEIDMVEEIARMYGYDKMPVTLPKGNEAAEKTRSEELRCLAKESLIGLGVSEIQTYSFVSPRGVDKINISETDIATRNFVTLLNPLGEENSVMRTQLTPNMMEVLGRNYSKNNTEVKLFEIGKIFNNVKINCDGLPAEADGMCIAMYGGDANFFTLKGILEELLCKLGIKGVSYVAETKYKVYHPGRCAMLIYDGELFGMMGEIHPDVAARYGISERVYSCELLFTSIMNKANTTRIYSPLPKYPAVSRDIALLVKEEVNVGDVEKVIRKNGSDILESVKLFDVYRGKQVAEDHKSIAFSLTYRDLSKTLTDEDVNQVHEGILAALKTELNAVLREM